MALAPFGLPGLAELVVLLSLLSSFGLPLGIPPAPEDPLMARVAPQQCVFYTTWSGTAAPDANSPNHTEQLLAEPEVQHLVKQIEQKVVAGLRRAAGQKGPEAAAIADDASKWAKRLLVNPAAMFVSHVKIGPAGPDVRAGAVIKVGDDAAQLKATLEKYQEKFLRDAARPVTIDGQTWYRVKLGPKAPAITWGVKGKCLILGVGEEAVEGILARARTAPPKWLADLRRQLPVDRTATVSYVNLKTLLDTFAPMGGPKAAAAIDAAGLANLTSAASVTGLEGAGFVNRTLLAFDGETEGLLRALVDKSLAPDDLGPIPRDATVALAARLDADALFEAFLATLEKFEPNAEERMREGVDELELELGLNLRDDLLKPLGDTWCVYNSPGEGGLVITGLTAVVKIDDHRRLAATEEKLVARLKAEFGQNETDRRRLAGRIEEFKFAGQDVYFFNARDNDFPLAPSWCLTEDALIVATFPQNIKAYLSRGPQFESLATVGEVAPLLQSAGGPTMLAYCDTPRLFEMVYPLVPFVAQVALGEMSREGMIDLDVSILPSAAAIGKHLRPSVAIVRRTEAGIELTSRQSFPGGNVGATAPVGVALLLPAVQAARHAARRTQSMNNLKQIALCLLNYDAAYGSLPPAFTTDAKGKPLLSWRVLILPYLEQKPLYDQFHLDEPWDSKHNKTLIARMPQEFKPPGGKAAPGKTNYLTVRGKNTVFPGKDKIKLPDILDGTSNTIVVVEVSDKSAVIWTKPDDFKYDEKKPFAGLLGLRPGGFNAVFCDGSVHFIAESIEADILKHLFIRNDGEVIDIR